MIPYDTITTGDWLQIVAKVDDDLVGSVDCIIRETTVEIDGLHVVEHMRHQGIGSQLQQYIMTLFPNKWVILVADGEDTPREMYRQQNYKLLGFQYEALLS